jgi:hypothetical protein
VKSPEKSNIDEAVRVAGTAPQTVAEAPVRQSLKPRVRKLAAQANTEMIASSQTAAKDATIDTWQSPTSGLLTSPAEGLFKSVPQLNENANEMKSFLPGRSNDKEK